jgi:leader peptidase (prepilin peptidase)/N-methyltransferase
LTYYWTAVSFLLGAVIGSFLNVVIYRLPRGESLVRPGSHCPGCGAAVRWHDNVPLLSWVWLRGRCRDCRERISLRYPAVELLTGVAFALTFWRLGFSWPLLQAWVFAALAIVIAFVYYDHSVVPDRILWPAVAVSFGLSVALDLPRWWVNVSAGLAAVVFTAGVTWLARGRKGKTGALKISDLGVALLVGTVLGFNTILTVGAALLLGLVFVLQFVVNRYMSFYH